MWALDQGACIRAANGDLGDDMYIKTLNNYYRSHHFINHSNACALQANPDAPTDGEHMSLCLNGQIAPNTLPPSLSVKPQLVFRHLMNTYTSDWQPQDVVAAGADKYSKKIVFNRSPEASQALPRKFKVTYGYEDGGDLGSFTMSVSVERKMVMVPCVTQMSVSQIVDAYTERRDLHPQNTATAYLQNQVDSYTSNELDLTYVIMAVTLLTLRGGPLNVLLTGWKI
jgi:hypothetical protein